MSKSLAKPLLLAALVTTTLPVSAEDSLYALKQMSLDELADLRVSTATHRSERLEDTAAAIHVLTAEDIRRAGATSPGVLWDELNIVMQDIERVEIVRGPGGSTWGANAVNGVINIITRHAEDTQGTLLSVTAGDLQSEMVLRNGFKAGESGHARVWAKQHQNDRLASTPR